MATMQRNNEPTPSGGVVSEIYYQDKDGNPVDQKVAVKAEIVELDTRGNVIFRTYENL